MLHLHAADTIQPLARRLAEVYSEPLPDALASEWLAVPSAGMERWVSLELARSLGAGREGATDGIAANIEFHFPDSLRQCMLRAGQGSSLESPWQVERLTWVVVQCAQDRYRDLPRALGSPLPGVSRFGAARRIADLFDRYHVHRPTMIRHWAADRSVDGTGRPLPPHCLWQPMLWRLCRQFIGEPSPPERLPDLVAAVRNGALELDLPGRVALFGLTLLPGGASFLDVAQAVACGRDVHLFLVEPSTTIHTRLTTHSDEPRPSGQLRSEDRTAQLVHHPLLRSWGRLHRETAVLLSDGSRRERLPAVERVTAGTASTGSRAAPAPALRGDHGSDQEPPRPSLLAELQADIRADRTPSGALRPDPSDRSIQLHACHGPTRQVEVARDVILHLLADPELDLSEDDVVILTPALDRFAPIIEGVFGSSADLNPARGGPVPGEPTGGEPTGEQPTAQQPPSLRYQIADRSIRTTNPALDATAYLVALLGSRFGAAPVLDFMASAPVARRFGFSSDDLARIQDWVHATEIRWGLTADHRRGFDVPPSIDTNTWEAGLDRLIVGMAVHGDGLQLAVGDVAPFEGGSDDAALIGRLAQLLGILGRLQRETDTERPIEEWMTLLRSVVPDLFETAPDQRWQLDALSRVLRTVVDNATAGGVPSPARISFTDVRRILEAELRAGPGRPNFFRGGVTVTSMTPLRGVPFRVVCLLGTDQEALATTAADGDDLTANRPLLGDRDPRGDLRLALLEAVLAAGDRLVVIRDGRDVRTNHDIPPPVVIDELTDTLGAMIDPALRPAFLDALEKKHPRQGHDERCFEPGAIVDGPWSFDPGGRAGALARRARVPAGSQPFLSAPLDPPASETIPLDQLHEFLRDPIRYFLERRLGLRLPRDDRVSDAVVPVILDGLATHAAGERLLGALLEGRGWEEWAAVEARLGTVPPGVLGTTALDTVRSQVDELYRATLGCGLRPGARGVPIDVTLGDGTRITGTVEDRLGPPAAGPCDARFTRSKPVDKVHAWLDLMALVATDPSLPWRAVTIRRAAGGTTPPVIVDLSPALPQDGQSPSESARNALDIAVDLYRRGLTEPIPLFPVFSHSVALGSKARTDWRPYGGSGDGDRPVDRLVFGECTFDDIMSIKAAPGDPEGTGGRVERFAHYLWDAVGRSAIASPAPPDDADARGGLGRSGSTGGTGE